ncbi:MAG TPA: hypothetical protein PLQ35_03010 [bacterium]|nr:hypothetical protein [bacterium]HQL61242.1 hypothetical protein [bacterium]
MFKPRSTARFPSRAPRRVINRPVLVREEGSLLCWGAQMVDFSLSGSLLAGFPSHGGIKKGLVLELIEGLDVEGFKQLAPLLSAPDVQRFETMLKKLGRQFRLRRSKGEITRVLPAKQQFAVRFDNVSDEGRTYPLAQKRNPPLRADFSYSERVGTFSVKGKLTPGAAIDLAKDVVHDIRQCLVLVDFSGLTDINRISVEKFCTRLRSELNEQDLAYALAVVSSQSWCLEVLGEIRGFPTVQEARDALCSGLDALESGPRTTDDPTSEGTTDSPSGPDPSSGSSG